MLDIKCTLIMMNVLKQCSRPRNFKSFFNRNSFGINISNVRLLASKLQPQEWIKPEGFDTAITLYHPVTKGKVPLILLHNNIIKWYACGPTVYDSAHIGHASSYVRQDIMRRILKSHFGIDSVFLMGITDIDDKIIRRSQETEKPFQQIVSLYENEFLNDLTKLNVMPPSKLVRVTQHIPHIISFIDGLIKKDFAYIAIDGSVYFNHDKYSQYEQHGVFAEREITHAESESVKRTTQDFALWKAQKPGEPFWEAPWGRGRPGWHIECSAMASSVFGCHIDIHSGGEDLIFPHHECENIQSCVYHDISQWANYWIHTGHLFIPGQDDKMSKSLNNVISVSDLLEKYTSNQFRMLCLLSTYRKQIEFSARRMDKAVATLKMFQSFITRAGAYVDGQADGKSIPEVEMYQLLDSTKRVVTKAFAEDFNTPRALAKASWLVKKTNLLLLDETSSKTVQNSVRSPAVIASISSFLQTLLEQLGIVTIGSARDNSSLQEEVQFHKLMDITVSSRDKIRAMAKDENSFLDAAAEVGIPREKASKLMKEWTKPLWELSDGMRARVLETTRYQINDGKGKSTWSLVEKIEKAKCDTSAPNTKGKS